VVKIYTEYAQFMPSDLRLPFEEGKLFTCVCTRSYS